MPEVNQTIKLLNDVVASYPVDDNRLLTKSPYKLILGVVSKNGYDLIFSYKTESKIIIITNPIANPMVPKLEWSPD